MHTETRRASSSVVFGCRTRLYVPYTPCIHPIAYQGPARLQQRRVQLRDEAGLAASRAGRRGLHGRHGAGRRGRQAAAPGVAQIAAGAAPLQLQPPVALRQRAGARAARRPARARAARLGGRQQRARGRRRLRRVLSGAGAGSVLRGQDQR